MLSKMILLNEYGGKGRLEIDEESDACLWPWGKGLRDFKKKTFLRGAMTKGILQRGETKGPGKRDEQLRYRKETKERPSGEETFF